MSHAGGVVARELQRVEFVVVKDREIGGTPVLAGKRKAIHPREEIEALGVVIGFDVFVISAIARDVSINETYRGVLPYVAADFIRLALVFFFPVLAVGLVRWLN